MDDIEWDPNKARANLVKHGLSFTDAVSALEDESALTIEDDTANEQRFVTIGTDAFGRVLVVVYTFRAQSIRIISARKATPSERQVYAKEKK
jgi:uncharacterized protein